MIRLDHLSIPVRDHVRSRECTLTFQVDDVESTYRVLSATGGTFEKSPQKLWGYGAELGDPDGYLVHLWDERSMREQGS